MEIETYKINPAAPSIKRFVVKLRYNRDGAFDLLLGMNVDYIFFENSIYFANECDRTLFLLHFKE